MPLKNSKVFLVIVAIAGIGLGAVGLRLIQVRWRSYDPVHSAELIPQEALMAMFVSPNSPGVHQLEEFGNRQTRQLISRNLNQIKQQSLSSTRLNFDRDLQPWIGGIMVALLPTSEELDLLMVIGIKDPLRAWMFQRKFKQQPNLQQIEREYRGVQMTEYIEPGGKQYYVAVLNHHVVIAAQLAPVKRAIDTFLGEPALAQAEGIVETFLDSAAVNHPLGAAVVLESQTLASLLLRSPEPQTQGLIEIISGLQPLQSAVMAVGVEPNGIRVRVVSQFDPQTEFDSENPELTSLIDRFPSDTVALLQGQGINQIWSKLLKHADENEEIAQWVDRVRQGLKSINLDADRDVLGWMDGDFALGAISSDEGILAPFGLGGVLLLETSDRPSAERMLAQLDATIANSQPPVNIEQRIIEDIEVTEWLDPQQGTLFGHGWLTDKLLFIAFGEPVVEIMTKLPNAPLPENPQFQRITSALPRANLSYMYLDIEQLISWATGYLLAAPAAALQPSVLNVLTSVEGVGVSVVYTEPLTTEVEMLWVLKSVTKE
ncbi:MAG: DUF3352 domain-containing protein [Microcoleaceae cyanobacterium]